VFIIWVRTRAHNILGDSSLPGQGPLPGVQLGAACENDRVAGRLDSMDGHPVLALPPLRRPLARMKKGGDFLPTSEAIVAIRRHHA
jgi:hypothetical protein